MEIKGRIFSLVGGLLSGIAIGVFSNYRDRKTVEPSILDRARALENKIYQDGEKQALLLAKIKQEAKLKAAMNAERE